MIKYAKIVNDRLQYPSASEFAGVPNYMTNDPLLRDKEYLPLVGEPEERVGYGAEPSEWHVVNQSSTRVEMRQTSPDSKELEETLVIIDTSYIQIDEWNYVELPEDTSSAIRDNAEKAIVGRILTLVNKYDALDGLEALLPDITIPSLLGLATEKNVSAEDLMATESDVSILVLDLMAKEGGTWQDCWEHLKSRFGAIVEELLQQ